MYLQVLLFLAKNFGNQKKSDLCSNIKHFRSLQFLS